MKNKTLYFIKKYGYKLYHQLNIIYSNLNTYAFDIKNYSDSFLVYDSKIDFAPQKVKKIVYCFWTGHNPLTENRKKGIESMQRNMGVEVKLITPENLDNYIVENHPLHPAYKNLSAVHKSDYLRCYFMHHHGGGYADVKIFLHNWNNAFDKINQNKNCYMLGYREIGKKGVAQLDGKLGYDLKKHYPKLIGVCGFICKPHSFITDEWITEVEKRLSKFQPQLAKNPGNLYGNNKDYPVPWANILAEILHPIMLKYNKNIEIDNSLFFDIENSGR
jgi:hypothetical protein